MMRNILGLHFDGDARAGYLSDKYPRIEIKVIAMDGMNLDASIMDGFTAKISRATGKLADYTYLPEMMPYEDSSSLEDFRNIIVSQRAIDRSSGQAVIYLILANKNKENGNSVGSTFMEDAIVLFQSMIAQNYDRNGDIEIYDKYVGGVLLHEFGHQLGLDHNNYPGCIMNKEVELGGWSTSSDIVTDFCGQEKNIISNMPV
jgi:predicted Zn-dependent protease